MAEYIEIDGVRYTEFQIKRALALERKVLSPNFVSELLGKTEDNESNTSLVGGF
ncbi:MAG: hypothetical protein Q4P14_04680 [Methanobacteriaceae archaeon]|nr:hypothetical protein [Methanobacteriaceae archaeon]